MDTVVVSGGGTGIGAAVVRQLSEAGRHVTVAGRRPEPLERVAGEAAGPVDAVVADVASPGGAAAVAESVREAGNRCAAVVAAAGGYSPREVQGLAGIREDWQTCFEGNVLTSVLLVEALREDLLAMGGRVVIVSSVAALRGSGGGPYGAMKAALHAWMYDLARDLGPVGGTANVVAPGFVPETGFWAGRLTERFAAGRVAQTLVGRAGTPPEVASMIGWLLGPEAGWVTGQIFSPNGGAVLGR